MFRPSSNTLLAVLVTCCLLATPVAGAIAPGETGSVAAQHRAEATSLELGQINPGNIFETDEEVAIAVDTNADRLEVVVTDYDGRVAGTRQLAASGGETTVELPVDGPGYYEIEVRALADGEVVATNETSAAIVEAHDFQSVEDSFFVVNTHFPRWENADLLIPLMRKAGVKQARDSQKWNVVEQEKGVYQNQRGYAEAAALMRENGIRPFTTIAFGNQLYIPCPEGENTQCPPQNDTQRQAYADYANWYVSEVPWRDQITHTEIWNEYNFHFSPGVPGSGAENAAVYREMLKAVYPAIKEARPDVTVTAGAAAWRPKRGEDDLTAIEWTEEILKDGGAKHTDAVSVHPYRRSWTPEDPVAKFDRGDLKQELDYIQSLTAKHNSGEELPLIISEFGYLGYGPGGVGNQTQARYLVRSHAMAKAAGVTKMNWYQFKARLPDEIGRAGNGLVRSQGHPYGAYTPRKAYTTYATTARQLTDFEPVGDGTNELAEDDAYSYRFTNGSTTRRAMWVESGTKQVTLETDEPVTVTRVTGESTTLTPHDGRVYATLSEDALFVTGAVEALEPASPFSISAATGVIGERIDTTVTVDRGAGLVDPVTIHSGERSQRIPSGATEGTVRAPPSPAFGDRTVLARVAVGGDPVALLQTNTTIENPVDAAVDVTLADDGAQTVSLTIDNNARRESRVTDVEWAVGDQQGTLEVGTTLSAGGSTAVELPVDRVEPWARHAADVTVGLADRDPVTVTREVGVNPIPRRSTRVDGDVSEHHGSSHISIADHADVRIDDADYDGPADLSGDVWLAWDDEGLTVAASVLDDNHTADFDPGTVWKGDSIQLGVSTAPPGSESAFYAYNVGETTQGDAVFRGAAIAEMPTRQVAENVDVAVERDDERGRTYYEATIPWSALRPADAEGPFALSLLVNDNDGDGREGFVEWASGIGSGKDTSQYRTVIPVESAVPAGVDTPVPSTDDATATPAAETTPTQEEEPATETPTAVTGSPTDSGTESPSEPQTEPPADTAETPADGPGFGALVAVLAVVLSGLLARRE